MLDYAKRFFVVLVIAACIGVLFLGGRVSKAMENEIIPLQKDIQAIWKV